VYETAWLNPDQITTQFGSEIRNAQEIKHGELAEGIVGGTVSGAVLELLQNISGISNRAEIIFWLVVRMRSPIHPVRSDEYLGTNLGLGLLSSTLEPHQLSSVRKEITQGVDRPVGRIG